MVFQEESVNRMGVLEYIIIGAVIAQLFFTIQVVCNHHYALKKHQRQRIGYRPQCVLIVPCKGLDEAFDKNIKSFFSQAYEGYDLFFVVEDSSDPAYDRLLNLMARYESISQAKTVEILVAGPTESCSQKLHNLLFAYREISKETEILAFADSDACAGLNWLAQIVYPLRKDKNGASSGYRCFIPQNNNMASLALSSLNVKVCQLLGNTPFNLAWGGSMAIRVKDFHELGIEQIWQKALSDDLSLSRAVRRHHRKMVFVPDCMIASFQTTTWKELWEFSRRQFIITRIYSPLIWLFGLLNTTLGVLVLWGSPVVTILAFRACWPYAWLYSVPPVLFWGLQIYRAILRQKIIATLLPEYKEKMKMARYADLFFFWAWSILFLLIMLSSVVGRTITWRNIRYRLNSPLDVKIVDP
ncbi:MAG: glycosyltransferase [Planctomycetes bacterium]|nr:glycosyltransferase [Planctomycetota bacterium]